MNKQFICKYCSKICKNKNSLAQHEIRCRQNPNRIQVISNFIIYNERVKNGEIEKVYKNNYVKAEKLGLPKPKFPESAKIKLSKVHKGRKMPSWLKEKISETQKRNYLGKSRWYTQTQHRLSYAEQYFMKIFINAKQHYHVNRYFLDFAYPEHKIYIEIDGEQHKKDPKVVKHDEVRTKILNEEGWLLYRRVYWPDFVKLNDTEKITYISNMLSELNSMGVII